MPYITGTANTLAELRDALVGACTANGWSWNSSTEVLSRAGRFSGKDLFVRLQISGAFLTLLGRSSASAGDAPIIPRIGGSWTGSSAQYAVVYPLTYFIHIYDYEVYLVINYSADFWQYCAFGQSSIPLPGTGMWVTACLSSYANSGDNSVAYSAVVMSSGNLTNNGAASGVSFNGAAPFLSHTPAGEVYRSSCIHHAFSPTYQWNMSDYASSVNSLSSLTCQLIGYLPNGFNSEAVLLPVREFIARSSGSYLSLVVDLEHCKITRNDYYQPGQVVTIGAEKWKIYPLTRKNASARNGVQTTYQFHSGTFAIAIRYDGP